MLIYWVVIGFFTILNLYVSVLLIRRDDLEQIQKILQILLVWLIPLLGAIGIWLLIKSQDDDDNNKPSKPSFGGGANDSIGAQ
ncbi:hypothetical protein [Glaciecola sp. 1036]|uniref:hypothetical protein n=1 Tax=Alteromonadaceae TaxID=72275 RepID=UPI003CFFD52E